MASIRIFLLILCVTFILGCASTSKVLENKTAEKIENETMKKEVDVMPKKNENKEYDSISAFLDENEALNKQLEITVDGEDIESPYGELKCVYFESGILWYEKENEKNFSRYSSGRTQPSEQEFYIMVAKHMIKIKPNSELRLFIPPTFQKEFKKENAPDFVNKEMFDRYSLMREMDYCLQNGKKYYILIRSEDYEYGAPDKSGNRGHGTLTFIQISDKEFINGKPQVEETPTYRGWVYG